MSKITIDQLAGMMQDEFSNMREGFKLVHEKIDSLADDTKKHFATADEKIDFLTTTVEWIATEIKTIKQELTFNQAAHDRYEGRILALEKELSLVREQLKK